jgi:hypothetical protein
LGRRLHGRDCKGNGRDQPVQFPNVPHVLSRGKKWRMELT